MPAERGVAHFFTVLLASMGKVPATLKVRGLVSTFDPRSGKEGQKGRREVQQLWFCGSCGNPTASGTMRGDVKSRQKKSWKEPG